MHNSVGHFGLIFEEQSFLPLQGLNTYATDGLSLATGKVPKSCRIIVLD